LRENRLIENVEMGIVKDKGEITWISVTAAPIPLEGYGVAIAYGDITERKRAEEAVRKSEEKYRGLTENINLGIYRNSVGPKGKFIEANPAIIGMFGYKNKEEFLAINVSDLYQNSEDRNKFNEKILKEGFVRGEELWLKKKDGSRFVGSVSAVAVKDEQGHLKYYDGIIDDITERKRAEEALRESKEFAENLIGSMLDGISVLDSDGVHIDVNATLCQMTGFSREELIGVGLPHPYWPPEAYKEIETAFQKTLRGEFSDVELTFMRKNGERFSVIVSPSWVKDKQGNVTSYFATVKDITERKRAEEEKRRLEERSRKIVEDIFRFIPEGVLVFSRKMELLRQNQAFREMVSGYAGRLGFAEDELENLIIDKIKAGLGDKNIKEIRIPRKHETGK